MSTYEELSSTVDEIVKQAILAELRVNSSAPYFWVPDSQESPTSVTFTWASGQMAVQQTLDWTTGAVTKTIGRGSLPEGTDATATFLAWKSKWQEAIPPLFDKFFDMPDPADFGKEATGLNPTGDRLNGGGFTIGAKTFTGGQLDYYLWQIGSSVESTKLAGWSGDAATTFRDKYIKTWPGKLSNQYAAVCLMKMNIEREQKLWTTARKEIALTADEAVKAMKAADGPSADFSLAITIFSAVIGVASVAFPVGAAAGAAVITGALSIADAAMDEPEKKTMKFGAETPDGVFTKIDEGLNDFSNEVWDAEYVIYRELSQLQDALHARDAFMGTGADDLISSTDPYDVGVRGDVFEVSEIKDLRSFAALCGQAAADARSAATSCVISSPSGTRSRKAGLGYGSNGAADEYANCAAMLQDIIADTGITIGDAGVQLDAAANTYSDTDRDSQNRMQDRSQDLTDMRKDDEDMPAPPPPPLPRHGPMPV